MIKSIYTYNKDNLYNLIIFGVIKNENNKFL